MITGLCRTVAVVAVVAGLAGCGGGTSSGTSSDTSGGGAGSSGTSLGQEAAQVAERPAEELSSPAADESTDFPAELVGLWARTSNAGTSPAIEFAPTGEFQMGRFTGTAGVRGSSMVMRIDGQGPSTVEWSLHGGVLELGGAVYLRDDRGAATPSIVGYWINDNGWTSVRFESDGSFQLDDQANAVTTVGTYTLDGNRLVLSSRTQPTGIYLIQLDDGMSFADVNGAPIAHYTRAG
jgi:hypothetical protein